MLRLMGRHGVRFHPPALAMGPAVRWMLLRAFGPVGAAGAGGSDGPAGLGGGAAGVAGGGGPAAPVAEAQAVLELSRRFELVPASPTRPAG